MTWIPRDVIFSFHLFHRISLISPSMCGHSSVGTQSASNRRSLGRSMARGRTRCGMSHMHSTGKCCAGRKSCKVQLLRSRRSCCKIHISKLCLEHVAQCLVVYSVFTESYRRRLESREVLDLQTGNRNETNRGYFQHLPAARQVAKDLENVLLDCGGTALEAENYVKKYIDMKDPRFWQHRYLPFP